jgi:uncharacterized protein YecE (DUF72 family)
MATLKIGTCSWKYPSWSGLVYSAPKNINYLEEYARNYDTVEVDQWFWSLFPGAPVRLPDPADVTEYGASVPGGFRFTVKAPNSVTLTHYYKKAKAGPLVDNPHFLSVSLFQRFLSLLGPIKNTLGPLMFQFEYLNKQKMKSQKAFMQAFEEFVVQLPREYEYAVEVRNAAWLNEPFFDFLLRNKLIPVFIEGYWMPPVAGLYQKLKPLIARNATVIVRLHGGDRQKMEKTTGKVWDRLVDRRDDELAANAKVINDILGRGVNVYLNVNNHYEGSAPLTINRIKTLLGRGELF